MIDDTQSRLPPGRSPSSARARGDVVRELREGVADRLPVPLRALPAGVPWRAALLALVLAVVVGSALLAHGQSTPSEVTSTVPHRAATLPAPGPGGSPAAAAGASGGQRGISGSPSGGVMGAPNSAGSVAVVHVVGRVRRPGLVRLAAGSRVADAVTAAGGAGADARLDRLNLARPVSDGEQISVPGANDPVTSPVTAASGVGGGSGRVGAPDAPVDLNTATAADLDALPGVGPVLAGRILTWRDQHGRFTRVAELGEVPGIGDKLLARLTPLVRV